MSDLTKGLRSAHAGQISEYESQRIVDNLLVSGNDVGNSELRDGHMSCLYDLWFASEGVMRPSGKCSISIQTTKGKSRWIGEKNQDPLAYEGRQ